MQRVTSVRDELTSTATVLAIGEGSLPSLVAMLTKGHRNLNSWPRDGKPGYLMGWLADS